MNFPHKFGGSVGWVVRCEIVDDETRVRVWEALNQNQNQQRHSHAQLYPPPCIGTRAAPQTSYRSFILKLPPFSFFSFGSLLFLFSDDDDFNSIHRFDSADLIIFTGIGEWFGIRSPRRFTAVQQVSTHVHSFFCFWISPNVDRLEFLYNCFLACLGLHSSVSVGKLLFCFHLTCFCLPTPPLITNGSLTAEQNGAAQLVLVSFFSCWGISMMLRWTCFRI